ncbi:hypothetical protein KR222_007468 [Zaprionus bogoriensis]|nr:hypothetical protein KR222_007468 [Zaprionus bogoriensis]
MSSYEHSQLHENFLKKPSVMDDLQYFLEVMHNKDAQKVDYSAGLTDDSFYVMARSQHDLKKKVLPKQPILTNINQMTFMRQIDVDDNERIAARAERMHVAAEFRRLGNAQYRNNQLDKAINFYSMGLCYIVDSPVLYVNRGLCYIKKRAFARALLDLDHVLNHIDGSCLRAWLYRGAALKRMNNEAGFEKCVANAREFNRSATEYIEEFLVKMKSEF